MKILVVSNMYPERSPKLPYTGVFVKEQIEQLQTFPVDQEVFVIDGFKGPHVYAIDSIRILFKILAGSYDVVHVHYGISALFVLVMPFRRLWQNTVVTLHGGDILEAQGKRFQVALTKLIIRLVGVVIVLSDEMKSKCIGLASKVYQIPCGVDVESFRPDLPYGLSNRIVFPGSPDREVKNYPLFLEVISIFEKKYFSVECVVLHGLTRAGVRDALSNAAAVLMTSRSEGSPQVIKEALAMDIAVTSSDVGNVSDMLTGVLGTRVFDLEQAPSAIADMLYASIVESKASPGARRSRIFDLGLDSKSVSHRLFEVYSHASMNR